MASAGSRWGFLSCWIIDWVSSHAVVCDCFCSCNRAQMNMFICVSLYLWESNSRDFSASVVEFGLVQSGPRAHSELIASDAVCDDPPPPLPSPPTPLTLSPHQWWCVALSVLLMLHQQPKGQSQPPPHQSLTIDATLLPACDENVQPVAVAELG